MFSHLKITASVIVALLFLPVVILAEPLTREGAVQIALEHNPEVIAAYHVWKAESARSLQTWALPDPELELEYEGMPGAFQFGSFEQKELGIVQRLEFPITWWLQTRRADRQAQATRFATYETTRLDIAYRVRLLYDRVLANAQIVDFARQNVQLANNMLTRAKTRFAAGDVSRLDVMRAEASLQRHENHLLTTQNNLTVSQSKLNALLNRNIDAPIALADSLDYESVLFDVDVLQKQALKQRPENLGIQHAYASARSAQKVATLSLLPDVSLGIFRQTTNNPAGRQKFWRTGIAVELPVWGLLKQRGQIIEAKAQLSKAKAERDHIQMRIAQEVHAASSDLQSAVQKAQRMQQRILPAAEAAYDMARRSYDAGKAAYIDVIETQRVLMDTKTEYAETLFEYRAARAQLARAIGSDLTTEERKK